MIKTVKAIARRNNGEILLVKHRKSKMWSLPGGRIKNGELEIEALHRELEREEVPGLRIVEAAKYHGKLPKQCRHIGVYSVRVEERVPVSAGAEISDVIWAGNYRIYSLTKSTEKLLEYLSKVGYMNPRVDL